ncbi:MAG: SpoIID/LytB domain-containing protein [Paludibacteraceae bacterium]|nr:SpoIID/LytB domain-containing protein [Paludibacteraceae bacterium]
MKHEIAVGVMTAPKIEAVIPGPHSTPERPTFLLKNVRIGIGFHWDRLEDQEFEGTLEIRDNADGTQTAINRLDVEDYLSSVITSEMSATSSLELLKAHAVISRSWVLRPIISPSTCTGKPDLSDPDRHVIWYERDAHEGFDVCADDHCQRYEGITRRDEHPEAAANVQKAIDATRGQVLMYDGKVCDARFYKSCGGATELFENAWANEHYPYLEAVRDEIGTPLPDLTIEENAQEFIRTSPSAYCNTTDARVLSQVLNNYDQETKDFYRWTVQYTAAELSEIIRERSGIDFGEILDLVPIKRGPSARLYEMQIVGSKRTMVIGKELEIRKWLSRSHLYSSAFVVDRNEQGDFIFTGAGWGHGVGLCQIGAAVMADKGYTYEQILAHYFPGSELKTI